VLHKSFERDDKIFITCYVASGALAVLVLHRLTVSQLKYYFELLVDYGMLDYEHY